MRTLTAAILLTLTAIAAVPAAAHFIGHRLASPVPPGQGQLFAKDASLANVSLGPPSWQRAGGLLVGELTLSNGNAYPVANVIIACDFVDASGHAVTRGTAIRRVFGPGTTRIDGVEFARFARDTRGGACRMLSAKPAGAQRNDVE